jgi:hypothetical protein
LYYVALFNHESSCVFLIQGMAVLFLSSFEIHRRVKYTTSWLTCCVKTSCWKTRGHSPFITVIYPLQYGRQCINSMPIQHCSSPLPVGPWEARYPRHNTRSFWSIGKSASFHCDFPVGEVSELFESVSELQSSALQHR